MFKIFFLKAHELVERVSAFFGNVIFRTFLMFAVFHCAPFFFQFEVVCACRFSGELFKNRSRTALKFDFSNSKSVSYFNLRPSKNQFKQLQPIILQAKEMG